MQKLYRLRNPAGNIIPAAPLTHLIKTKRAVYVGMSAIGTKRTSLVAPHMSAFGGKADIARDLLKFTHFIISSTDGQDADSGGEQGRSGGYEFESHSRKRNQTAGPVSVEL